MSQEININSYQRDNSYTNNKNTIAPEQPMRNDNVNTHDVDKGINRNEKVTDVEKVISTSNNKLPEDDISEEITEEEINEAVDVVSAFMNNSFKHVGFSTDTSSGKTIIKVVDKETKELISQFPSEKMLAIAAKINGLHLEIEDASGLLVDNHV